MPPLAFFLMIVAAEFLLAFGQQNSGPEDDRPGFGSPDSPCRVSHHWPFVERTGQECAGRVLRLALWGPFPEDSTVTHSKTRMLRKNLGFSGFCS
jgi:hypothetical protein